MDIDIRSEKTYKDADIRVRFSEDAADNACLIQLDTIEGDIELVDQYGVGDHNVRLEDIDNLIKALQKAKELWT